MPTIGDIYREKILNRDDLVHVEFPNSTSDAKIEKDLFGIKLFIGKEFIECDSELEARYLKVFYDTGLMEIEMPKDNELLKEVVPKLEEYKEKVDKVMNEYLRTIFDRKARVRLKHEVYMEIVK